MIGLFKIRRNEKTIASEAGYLIAEASVAIPVLLIDRDSHVPLRCKGIAGLGMVNTMKSC
jgi:hypothetical protein